MSRRSGITTQRRVVETYKGFSIIKLKVINWYKSSSGYYYDFPEKVNIYYSFCKEGEETRPSQAYSCNANNIDECKKCIDAFIKDDCLYFTDEERNKYVYGPNRKCNWAYGYNSLMKIMREHKKAAKRMKHLLEDRLTDANFHSECGFLSEEDYDGFTNFVRKNFKFREKFEIITETECKRINNPKQFEDGLAKVIEDYLVSQGVKDTSVKAKFIEDW